MYRYLPKFIRVLIAASYGFVKDECYLKASALTFYSLLSIVPVLAVAFGIAKGFGFDQTLETQLRTQFQDYEVLVSQAIDFAYSLLKHTQGGLIAGVGVITLFWTVLRLLNNIEDSFNRIWKVRSSRSWSRRFSDYLATILICPVIFVASSSLTVFLTSQIQYATEHHQSLLGTVGPFLLHLLKLLPFLLIWLLFTFMYLFMSNAKVPLKSAVIAGITAGTAFQFFQWSYIYIQLKLSNYGAIYGSFAALPLFLVWLQLSWVIVLAGAEIAFFSEKDRADTFLSGRGVPSFAAKKKLAVYLVYQVIQNFKDGEAPLTALQLSSQVGSSYDITKNLLTMLSHGKILSQVVLFNDIAYQPAVDPRLITVKAVYEALENEGSALLAVVQSEKAAPFFEQIDRLDYDQYESLSNQLVEDL